MLCVLWFPQLWGVLGLLFGPDVLWGFCEKWKCFQSSYNVLISSGEFTIKLHSFLRRKLFTRILDYRSFQWRKEMLTGALCRKKNLKVNLIRT